MSDEAQPVELPPITLFADGPTEEIRDGSNDATAFHAHGRRVFFLFFVLRQKPTQEFRRGQGLLLAAVENLHQPQEVAQAP